MYGKVTIIISNTYPAREGQGPERTIKKQMIDVFDFSIGYNGEFGIFEKKSLKIRKSKFQNPKCSFVRTIGKKIQDKFQNVWL